MKKNYQIFIGIDVSKSKLDYCVITDPASTQHQFGIVANTEKGIKQLIATLKKNFIFEDIIFCLENTGVYSMPFCYWAQHFKIDYWVVPALEIKKAKGITRGKNDKADAKDIASYCITHLHLLKLTTLPENDFIELRLLLAEREKLVKAIGMFKMTKEGQHFLPKEVLKKTLAHNKKTTEALEKQLNAIEKIIQTLIDNNPTFKEQQKLLVTVPGVGKQTSVNLIVATYAFTAFKNWRKFACYCGVAPFEYTSGSSIRGKTKVSHLANKKLKALLNMAALSAKRNDIEMKAYYDKKVKEGKNKMLVLNSIRCKIISRAFAVVQRNTPFVNLNKFKTAA
jgi:transposase